MRTLIIAAAIIVGLSGCTRTERGAAAGGAIGAGAGLLATGKASGALVGGAAGAVVGALIGRSRDGRCVYRDRRGRRYVDDC